MRNKINPNLLVLSTIPIVILVVFVTYMAGCQTGEQFGDKSYLSKTKTDRVSEDDYLLYLQKMQVFEQQRSTEKTKPQKILESEKYYDKSIGKYVDVVKGEILVKFKRSFSAQSIGSFNKRNQARMIRSIPNAKVNKITALSMDPYISVEELIKKYESNPSVEYAQPNFIIHQMSTIPNDPFYGNQWGLDNIEAPLGWDIEKGSPEIQIAIIDSGIDMLHDDLVYKIWVNVEELNGLGDIDDDDNGYVDDIFGWDFASWDNFPDDIINGHGSHASGIAAASTDNGMGVAGVDWNAEIMILRVINYAGASTVFDAALAIYYAVDNGAEVINLSLGGSSFSTVVNDAIQYAHNQGCVIVASAGNNGDSTIIYPASYDNAISVASVDNGDNHSSFSNYNAHVDICAPGGDGVPIDSGDIYSSIPIDAYGYKAGTSMAAPFASGLAALLLSLNPNLTNTQIEDIIFASADDFGASGRDDYFGHGRINVFKALQAAKRYHSYIPGVKMISIPFYPQEGENSSVTLNVSGDLKLARWDPETVNAVKHKYYPDSFVNNLLPGEGYFVKLDSGTIIEALNGYPAPTDSDFEIQLKKGWNQIGDPFPNNIEWNSVNVRDGKGTTRSMMDAVNNEIIKSGPWKYLDGNYELSTILEPWEGYWVRVSEDVALIIPHP
jgi:subtilisin family serine protease